MMKTPLSPFLFLKSISFLFFFPLGEAFYFVTICLSALNSDMNCKEIDKEDPLAPPRMPAPTIMKSERISKKMDLIKYCDSVIQIFLCFFGLWLSSSALEFAPCFISA